MTPGLPPPTLTREQRAAVHADAHALAIHAGAGTGKTLTLAHRVARLGPTPQAQARLVVVTFTREATASLQRKLALLLGRGHQVRVTSFHQWATRELPPEARRFLDERAQRDILAGLLKRAGRLKLATDASEDAVTRLQTFLGLVKNRETTVEDAIASAHPHLAPHVETLAEMQDAYETAKAGRLDYDDLLLVFRDRLRDAAFRRGVASRIDHVLVDEYQDVNTAQAQAIHLLTTPRGAPRVTVVGDPRQAIYGFRGGGPEHLDGFLAPYGPRGRLVALTRNFRSARRIVEAANALEPGPHPMRAATGAAKGLAPEVVETREEGDDALARVEALMEKGVDPREIAVLARARHLARPFALARERRLRDADAPDGLADVQVRTIHAAKGLEFDHVVLVGAREGGIPSMQALRASALLPEERRLAYVALTRARRSFVAVCGGVPSRYFAKLVAGPRKGMEKMPTRRSASASGEMGLTA